MILAGIFFIFLFLFFVFVFASSSSPLLSLSLFFFYFSSPLFLLRSHPTLTSFFHLLSVILIHIRLKFILGNARPFSKIQLQARPSFSHIYQSVIHFTDGFSRRLIRLRLKISSAAHAKARPRHGALCTERRAIGLASNAGNVWNHSRPYVIAPSFPFRSRTPWLSRRRPQHPFPIPDAIMRSPAHAGDVLSLLPYKRRDRPALWGLGLPYRALIPSMTNIDIAVNVLYCGEPMFCQPFEGRRGCWGKSWSFTYYCESWMAIDRSFDSFLVVLISTNDIYGSRP